MNEKEIEIANVDDLAVGEMKQLDAEGVSVLLANVEGTFHAVGATCTHYGAPLADGVLCGTRVVCPWHHACFDVATGDRLEPPAMDALPRYETRVDDGKVFVRVPADPADVSDRRPTTMVSGHSAADTRDMRLFAILGAGAAGYSAAQALREDGFRGRIVMITREKRYPYDRPNLSKDYLNGHAQPEWMPLRPDEFFAEHGIEVMLGREVTGVDAEAKTIEFAEGEPLAYDALLLAMGGEPRKLPVPGADLAQIFTLRSFDDADAIIAALDGATKAVVIGASFIGMEAAASLVARGIGVTIVAPESIPYERTLGPQVGSMFGAMHAEKGVAFRLGASVAGFEGNGKVEAVVLGGGDRLDADIVIVGAGVRPATGFLKGFDMAADGGILVDDKLRAADGIWAAGDIASFVDERTGELTRIEHWRTAQQQGRIAAHNMLGREAYYDSVPFFWTMQFDGGLQYVGHATSWDDVIVHGEISERDFLAFYVKGSQVLAVAGTNRDRDLCAIEELMRLNRMPEADVLREVPVDWVGLLAQR
jgi:apoptosis-inducing factor 3